MQYQRKYTSFLITTVLLVTITACGSGDSTSSGSDNINASGNWSLVTTSNDQFDTTGAVCLSGSGTMSVSNQRLTGTFTGNSGTNEITGTVDSNGTVGAQFTRAGQTIGNVLGSFSNLSGSGTWADTLGCSGDWTATS